MSSCNTPAFQDATQQIQEAMAVKDSFDRRWETQTLMILTFNEITFLPSLILQ